MPPRTPSHKIAVEYRDRAYPLIPLALEPGSKKWLKAKARSRRLRRHRLTDEEKADWKWLPDPGGHGLEIVREVVACPFCAEKVRQTGGLRLPDAPKVTPASSSSRAASSRASA